ncbi:hypothetical protein BX600DRAFT_467865 [Xylariales sp. PMI_506]|nr:hypothetical protein BX600DRAFT_467865 [Xylariales sp. PMI_506]
MEPQAKRRRFGSIQPPHVEDIGFDPVGAHRVHGDSESAKFDGSGIQNQRGIIYAQGNININSNSSSTPNECGDNRSRILESLRFDHMNDRQMSIKKAHTNTCKWLLNTPLYDSWMARDIDHKNRNFLWIRGKPGAGKCTLMKFLFGHVRLHLRRTRSDDILISFFLMPGAMSWRKARLDYIDHFCYSCSSTVLICKAY